MSQTSSAAFSPDGARIVTANQDKTASVWDAADGRLLVSLSGHTDAVYGAAFSADGCGAASCSPLWSSTTGAGLTAPSVVNDLVFTGGDAGRVQAWRTTGCGSATCDPIASLPQGSRVGNVTPISRARVFVVDGNLRKLMLPD